MKELADPPPPARICEPLLKVKELYPPPLLPGGLPSPIKKLKPVPGTNENTGLDKSAPAPPGQESVQLLNLVLPGHASPYLSRFRSADPPAPAPN